MITIIETNTDIRIRAFRAIDDKETCIKFIQGHRKVLSIYGIENITTNTDDWIYNPSIFVIVVESMDSEKLYGGARIQAYDGIHSLPIEEATGEMDKRIYTLIRNYARQGIVEFSGLWNSKEVAGLGIGSLFPTRVGVVLAEQLGIHYIISLCSPTTVRFNKWLGSRVLNEIGKEGTFYYPKLNLLATAIILEDVVELSLTHPREKEKINFLRKHLVSTVIEKSPFKPIYVNVHYDLLLKNVASGEFIHTVELS